MDLHFTLMADRNDLARRYSHDLPPENWPADGFNMELSPFFSYNLNVFSLNPTFVEIETPDTRNLLDLARAGDAEAFGEICRVL